jgi:hypothetical protein
MSMIFGVARIAGVIVVAAGIACGVSSLTAQDTSTFVDIRKNRIEMPPADFEFQQTGNGEFGEWKVVVDPSATAGLAIEHLSTDPHEDRFPLAIYKPLWLENVEVTGRFKIISGTMLTAGIAVGLRDPGNYYVVSASALEQRVDLLLFANGEPERIEGTDANIALNRWHALKLIVNDDHFTVSLDGKKLFTTFDRARMKDGHVALWTREDNVTRFDQIEIHPLPRSW